MQLWVVEIWSWGPISVAGALRHPPPPDTGPSAQDEDDQMMIKGMVTLFISYFKLNRKVSQIIWKSDAKFSRHAKGEGKIIFKWPVLQLTKIQEVERTRKNNSQAR